MKQNMVLVALWEVYVIIFMQAIYALLHHSQYQRICFEHECILEVHVRTVRLPLPWKQFRFSVAVDKNGNQPLHLESMMSDGLQIKW